MATRRRRADYVATLIYLDEPQLLAMKAGRVNMLALAVPCDDVEVARFVATTVSQSNWESYFDGNTDLRFLFTFPKQRTVYYFDLMKMVDGKVMMDPHDGEVPEADLPLPRLFASEHTNPFTIGAERSSEEQSLSIDGEWDIPEFGDFYQRYTEIYAFSAAVKNWSDDHSTAALKGRIHRTFKEKPFQGGFSYLHFYNELTGTLTRFERPQLDSIVYNSPGTVRILGDDEHFRDVRSMITRFLTNRIEIEKAYHELYKYLQQSRLLKMAGAEFGYMHGFGEPVRQRAEVLSREMGIVEYEVIRQLTDQNELVSAKILLSLNRRILEAATFFAQGRMEFGE